MCRSSVGFFDLLCKLSLILFVLLNCGTSALLFADSGNGTGSTNSSRPQSQVIVGDPHVTPSNSNSPQLKLSSDKVGSKEAPEKLHGHGEVATSIEVKNTEELSQPISLITSNDAISKSSKTNNDNTSDATKNMTNGTPEDITGDTTKDITSDTANDTTSDTTIKDNTTDDITKDIISDTTTSSTAKDTTSDMTKDTTSDTTKDTTNGTAKDTTSDTVKDSNFETAMSKAVAKETDGVSISDIAEDTVADRAWQVNDKQEEKVGEKEPVDAKKNVDKLNLKNDFEEEDDVFVTDLSTHFARKSQFDPASPKSPNMSPRLSVNTSSNPPISMSPRPRRSSFVSSLCVLCVTVQ